MVLEIRKFVDYSEEIHIEGFKEANDPLHIFAVAAFGGFNQSGYAREAGKQSILDYTRTKTTWINTSDEPMKNPFVMR